MADVVSSQRFFLDDFVALAETGTTDSAEAVPVLISLPAVPAPADTALLTLFVRDSEPPFALEVPTVDNVLLERE